MEQEKTSVQKLKCAKCGRVMAEGKFYRRNGGGYHELCKACLTMHIDNFDPETFTWILKDLDYPYIPSEWFAIANKEYLKNPEKFNGQSVLGRYCGKMHLTQYLGKTWDDAEEILKDEQGKEEEYKKQAEEFKAKLEADFQAGNISETQYKSMLPEEELVSRNKVDPIMKPGETLSKSSTPSPEPVGITFFDETQYLSKDDLPDPAAELTHEDKIALAIKWGRTYTPNDWIALEQNYQNMKESFDIQEADSENALRLICKTYLKMDQAIDIGDLDGYTKLSKTYESLRKTAKFTAAQNKSDNSSFVDCIGDLVRICEKEGGFIPRYVTDVPQDKVDATLLDMNKFMNNLIKNEMGFGQQIEDALQRIRIQQIAEEEEREKIASGEIEDPSLTDEDFAENYERIAAEVEEDVNTMRGLGEEDTDE